MPMCTNRTNRRYPGPINGSALNGLCERACIEVKKVYDGCVSRMNEQASTQLYNFSPINPTFPLAFEAANSAGQPVGVSNLTVTPLANGVDARVRLDLQVPITCTYIDANAVSGTAQGVVLFHRDIVMCLPPMSVTGFTIEASGSLVSTGGSIDANGVVTFDCCTVYVIKVIVNADLLVPCYGYSDFPACVPYGVEVCEELFETPLFPRNRFR